MDSPLQSGRASILAKVLKNMRGSLSVGLALELPANLELPIELRASKNLSQDSDWASRVDAPNLPVLFPYTVAGQNTWDFRLGVGLGYRF